ncbi:Sulfur carrier protein CysO [subsurface metagenome]|nr:MoaD family protein [Bacillota bacterium]
MTTSIKIPAPLRKLTGNQAVVETEAETLIDLISDLDKKYPGIKEKIYDGKEIRRFINVFVNGEDVRFKDGIKTKITKGSEVSIVPAIAGG